MKTAVCMSRPPLRPYGRLGTIMRMDRAPTPERDYWKACTKLWRVVGCRGRLGRVPLNRRFGTCDWAKLARWRKPLRIQLLCYPNLCSPVACDWCGAEMYAIAPIETGMARGQGLTYLCRCGHELEVLSRRN